MVAAAADEDVADTASLWERLGVRSCERRVRGQARTYDSAGGLLRLRLSNVDRNSLSDSDFATLRAVLVSWLEVAAGRWRTEAHVAAALDLTGADELVTAA